MLRIATLNLLHSPKRLRERLEHLASLLKHENIDFLCLQEVPSPERVGFYVGDVLGYKLGLHHKAVGGLKDEKYGNVTLSRYPIAPIDPKRLNAANIAVGWGIPPLVTGSQVEGRPVYIINAHFDWGPGGEARRLRQASDSDLMGQVLFERGGLSTDRKTRPVVVLAGDLNAVPETRTMRYLRGLDMNLDNASTLWLDAWVEAGVEKESHTTGDPTYFSQETFKSVGEIYRPQNTPLRRIDYIMTFGWSYGNAGQPVGIRRFGQETFFDPELGDLTVSDHYGLIADLWMPEPEGPSSSERRAQARMPV